MNSSSSSSEEASAVRPWRRPPEMNAVPNHSKPPSALKSPGPKPPLQPRSPVYTVPELEKPQGRRKRVRLRVGGRVRWPAGRMIASGWARVGALTAGLVIYWALGTLLLAHLEAKESERWTGDVVKWRNDTAVLLATELRQVKPYDRLWASTVFHFLRSHEEDLLLACRQGYHGPSPWSAGRAIFFTYSLLTTTGYGGGHVRTTAGKLCLLVYTALGVPLALSWVVLTATGLASLWSRLVLRVFCHPCFQYPRINPIPVPHPQQHQANGGHHIAPQPPPHQPVDVVTPLILLIFLFAAWLTLGCVVLYVTHNTPLLDVIYVVFLMLVTLGADHTPLDPPLVSWPALLGLALYLLMGQLMLATAAVLSAQYFSSHPSLWPSGDGTKHPP